MALGLIGLGSATDFLTFVSVGIKALALKCAEVRCADCSRYAEREAGGKESEVKGAIAEAVGWIGVDMTLFSMPMMAMEGGIGWR